ncbi:MAG: DegT/DnrJ/EryC1/StrS family aminotransferase [Burkholderiaceae bacterium]|nr:DegT/DnrJ/EryC1/StrS family aminotransferase [Burkholderiaceae bacterium]
MNAIPPFAALQDADRAAIETAPVSPVAPPVFVTQPTLPPLAEFLPYLMQIWENKQLTNGGPYHQQLEAALCEYLGVKHISLFSNGTLGLITALQALRVTGEVITTPYSFVATAHSLLWNSLTPVFVDIDPVSLNIDPRQIEAAITPRTTAIMPVHCYSIPCDVDAIARIGNIYNLKVIYDAAHTFGARYQDRSLLDHGDMSVVSFHATKVFNTFEGGAIISHDLKTKQRVDFLKNFGFADEVTVVAPGINGKMSEINAAFGMLQLKGIDAALAERERVAQRYRAGLAGIDGIRYMDIPADLKPNNAYFPIFVDASRYGHSRNALYDYLKAHGINGRRYFYPLISDFSMYRGLLSAAPERLPIARAVAEQVICLPMYPQLANDVIDRTVELIRTMA